MHAAIGTLDRPAPALASGDFGTLRSSVLMAHITNQRVLVPKAVAEELDSWAASVMASAKGPAIGLKAEGIPPLWFDVLGWSGVPISAQGPLQWGVDIYEADVPLPEFQGAALVLPPPPLLAQLTSLALKPLRMLATRQLNIRLQAATGLQLYVWANQAVLVSRAEVPLGGFLHGPEPGTRHSLSVPVGGSQVITW
jgi:hypothetical protein